MGKINVKWRVYVNENGIKVANFRAKSFKIGRAHV
jgi:hypothetical protein